MSKDKNFLDKMRTWAQSEAGYDDDDYDEMPDSVKDYSGKNAKVFNVFMMTNLDDYKKITECLKRGSACAINLENLSEEDVKATMYRIEGIIDAVRGSKVNLSETVVQLLPQDFVVRTLS